MSGADGPYFQERTVNVEAITELAALWRSEQSKAIDAADVQAARAAEECAVRYEGMLKKETKTCES